MLGLEVTAGDVTAVEVRGLKWQGEFLRCSNQKTLAADRQRRENETTPTEDRDVMVQIDIAYQGELRCKAVHEPSGTAMITDAPKDNQGQGASFSPTDLVATALGTCMMTLMGIAARRHEWDLSGTKVTVRKEMSTTPPRRIARLSVDIHVPHDMDEHQRKVLENFALTCPVHHSIHPEIDKPVTFKWGR